MNMNLNKNTIFYEFTVAQAVQVGLAHNALASDHCAPVYRFTDATYGTGVEVYMCAGSTFNFLHACFDDAYYGLVIFPRMRGLWNLIKRWKNISS